MSSKSFDLGKEDPVVQQFKLGLDAWEKPFEVPGAGEEVRPRGAVRTRGSAPSRSLGKLPPTVLPKDDPVVKKFMEGLTDWERSFEREDHQD